MADQEFSKSTFLIAPVRGHSAKAFAREVAALESAGWTVYWPARDTDQDDPTGLNICRDNLEAMKSAGHCHFIWDGKSQGCLFDLGMAFALGLTVKPISMPLIGDGKSFQAMVQAAFNAITPERRISEEGGEQCDCEWPTRDRSSLCGLYHRCDLPMNHRGEKHRCNCGWTRRWMERDAPDDT